MNSNQKNIAPSFTERLRQAGLRPSAQRLTIIEYLTTCHSHPTADEIYKALSPDFPTMSLTTVYNTLHALVDSGLLRELEIEPSTLRYDPAEQTPHGHFKCTRCGRIFDMPLPSAQILDSMPHGFRINSLDLILKGICPDCI